jgi:hypothetical protein
VIRAGNAYYAVKTGIWFTAAQPAGPWAVATSVPASIYAIPPTSPIYYVTFVRIYGVTDKAVFEGYTPGYLGAYVSAGGTVVYGTGYEAKPWIGDAWYPAPATYGVAAAPVFNPQVGYTYAFATGLATPSFSGTAQISSWLLGPLPVLRIHECQRVSRMVQAREAEEDGACRATCAGNGDRNAGSRRCASFVQPRVRDRVRELRAAGPDTAHGTSARVRHVDDHECGRRQCRTRAAARRADLYLGKRVLRESRQERRMGREHGGQRHVCRRRRQRVPQARRRWQQNSASGWRQHLRRRPWSWRKRSRARTSTPACRRAPTA